MERHLLFQSVGLPELNYPPLFHQVFLPSPLDDLSHAIIELDLMDQ